MKVATGLITLGLALGAVSEPIKRELADFKDIISGIQGGVEKLTTAINGFSGGSGDGVLSASDNVVSLIQDGVTKANSLDDLNQSDALQLTGPVTDLTDSVKASIDAIIAKKDAFVSAGLGCTVQDSLNQQLSGSDALATAISSKVPDSIQDIAKQLAAGISKQIQRGVDAYKGVDCSGNGGSTTGGSEPTGSSSTGGSEPTSSGGSEPTGSAEPTNSGSATPSPTGTGSATPTGTGSCPGNCGGSGGSSTYSMPSPTPSGGNGGEPAPFPGAAPVNGVSGLLLAGVAAVLAF